jgi:hypothetical protein
MDRIKNVCYNVKLVTVEFFDVDENMMLQQ